MCWQKINNLLSILVICQELFEKDFDMFFGEKGNFNRPSVGIYKNRMSVSVMKTSPAICHRRAENRTAMRKKYLSHISHGDGVLILTISNQHASIFVWNQ